MTLDDDQLATLVLRDEDGLYRGPSLACAAKRQAVEGSTLFVASTEAEDRSMDVVRQDWRLGAFKANPVILDNHDRRRVVGVGLDAWVARATSDEVDESMVGSLLIRVQWDLQSPIVEHADVGRQHLAGIRRAGSVGFRAGKQTERHKLDKDSPYYREPIRLETWWGSTIEYSGKLYERNELMEFSSATIPANPEAVQRTLGAPDVERAVDAPDARRALVAEVVREIAAGDHLDALVDALGARKRFLDLLEQRLRASGSIVRGLVEATPSPVAAPSFAARVLSHLRT